MVGMNTTGIYGAYSAYTTQNTINSKQDDYLNKADNLAEHSSKVNESSTRTTLSEKAQKLLDRIKEKYGDMDIFVADYSSDEEARSIMDKGTKEFSVLFSAQELEKMASDEAYCQEKFDAIDRSVEMAKQIDEKYGLETALEQPGTSTIVNRFGITVNSDGTTSFFAELEEVTQAQKERIQKTLEKHAEEKKAAKEAEEDFSSEEEKYFNDILKELGIGKSTTLTGSPLENLLEAIEDIDWSKYKLPQENQNKIDFTV